jgi:RNA polymerase sigma-70 factor (ECF subfamily)
MPSRPSSATASWHAGPRRARAPHGHESPERRPLGPAGNASSPALSRERLLISCGRGDPAALRALYEVTAPQLFWLANSIVRSRELAEDVVQDAFVQVWRHAHRFDPDRGSAMAWLSRIVRNRCFDLLRLRRREAPFDDAIVQDWEKQATDPVAGTTLSREAQRLRDCLDELDEKPRQSLLLAYYGGLTADEISRRLGNPLGTVKSWIRRGLVQLKGCVENELR